MHLSSLAGSPQPSADCPLAAVAAEPALVPDLPGCESQECSVSANA